MADQRLKQNKSLSPKFNPPTPGFDRNLDGKFDYKDVMLIKHDQEFAGMKKEEYEEKERIRRLEREVEENDQPPTKTPSSHHKELTARKKTWWIPIGIVAVIAAVMIGSITYGNKINSIDYKYRQAEKLIEHEKFAQARNILWVLEDENYKDTEGLYLLCWAHEYYDDHDLENAYEAIEEARFSHQTAEQRAKINDFKSTVEKEYQAELKQQQQEERESQAEPSDKDNSEKQDEKETTSTRKKHKPYYPEVDEYKNTGPDEFYEYYPDDYFDYEDAEEYYNEHGGN